MNASLTGSSALVTGANSGIGQAIALARGNSGADVAVNDVAHPDAADAVVAQLKWQPCPCRLSPTFLTST